MDLVVGVESFVLNAAGAFDVPKIGIYTHGWPESIGKHFVNHDYVTPKNLQCSPCYMIPVDYSGVWDNPIVRLHSRRLHNYCTAKNDADPYQPAGYKCVNQVDMKELQHKVIRVIRGKTKKETANEKIQTQQLAG
jgi:ADP-heptose:LPS heptosyltransferase